MAEPQKVYTVTETSNKSQLLSALPMAVIVVDQSLQVSKIYGTTESLLQRSEKQLVGKSVTQIFGESSGLSKLVLLATDNQNSVMDRDLKLTIADGQAIVVDAQATPLLDKAGQFLITLQSREIPSIVGQQDHVKAASKSVSGLAAMLAHEIKNPLSGIRGAAQLLARRAADGDKKLPELICTEVDRIKGLVDDLEAFTDPKPATMRAVNIHEVLNHVSEVAKAGFASGIPIKAYFDPSLPELSGDFDRLVQVFLNLLKNAAEAMKDQAEPEIRITTAYRSGFWVGGEGENRKKLPFEISVADTGGGIAPDLIEHIFDPFVTGKEGGTGLGLALCAHYIADMDGAIECKNSEEGAVIHVRLPALEATAKEIT